MTPKKSEETTEPEASGASPATATGSGTAEETRFTPEELMSGAAAFGTTSAGMAGALRLAEIEEPATRKEAEAAVKDYLKREV